ncbi:hypothetical protein HPB50_025283 [Hyalomma asiaticum]|uniref:Uncharacterized protein n=1 Tax=Hyalomma asiaticum TaxID=266040 RepID=A0ACB7SQT1_HYAAI|nr:hypothetical protein HPB50_025283 [Hyalomma asiaticum]
MLGQSSTAVTFFQGPHVPYYVRFHSLDFRCRPYRKSVQYCKTCGNTGHRQDVCPRPLPGFCSKCGKTNQPPDHTSITVCTPTAIAIPFTLTLVLAQKSELYERSKWFEWLRNYKQHQASQPQSQQPLRALLDNGPTRTQQRQNLCRLVHNCAGSEKNILREVQKKLCGDPQITTTAHDRAYEREADQPPTANPIPTSPLAESPSLKLKRCVCWGSTSTRMGPGRPPSRDCSARYHS